MAHWLERLALRIDGIRFRKRRAQAEAREAAILAARARGKFHALRADDALTIRGRGVVIVGRLRDDFTSSIHIREKLELVRPNLGPVAVAVTGTDRTTTPLRSDPRQVGWLIDGVTQKAEVPMGTEVYLVVD